MRIRHSVGVLMAAGALLLACSDEDPVETTGDGSPVVILAESPTAPDGGPEPTAALVSTSEELEAAVDRFGFAGAPDVALDDGPVLFIGTVESSSCPATIESVGEPPADADLEADLFVELGHEGGPDCTADANPVTFVVRAPDVDSIRSVFVAHEGDVSSPLSGLVELSG